MRIIKKKSIIARDASEITDRNLMNFKDRAKLHTEVEIPNFFVYIQDYAWNAFLNHGNSVYEELKHEAQGIFVGHYFKDDFGEFVVATNYEEGRGSSESAYVEMSEECLAGISDKCQNNDTLMLIWVHTHPGFGVFYSGTDYGCLKTNFYKPYQIGIVVDNLRKQHKGFKTKGNDVIDFSNYALFNEEQNILFSPFAKIAVVKKNKQADELIRENNGLKKDNDELKKENDELKRESDELKRENEQFKMDLQTKISEVKQYEEKLHQKKTRY